MSKVKFHKVISVPIDNVVLEGELVIPPNSDSLVIFSHGSGSSRFSSRNNYVASVLQKKNISTFLFDLLTREEDEIYSNRFDIDLLSQRLAGITKYVSKLPECEELKIGYFGASTGAASAIYASILLPETISAIVSRGGRPDLAMDVAIDLQVPTLLIVGGFDTDVIQLNKKFYDRLNCEKAFNIVPGASHLFEEEGTLEQVAFLATSWFNKYLTTENEKFKIIS